MRTLQDIIDGFGPEEMSIYKHECAALQKEADDFERRKRMLLPPYRNRKEIESSRRCGCYYCFQTFKPATIREWIDDNRTALCPHCRIDSVVSTPKLRTLRAMNRKLVARWRSWSDASLDGDGVRGIRGRPNFNRRQLAASRRQQQGEKSPE